MDNFITDLKFGLRNLRSQGLYTAIALVTLALGIGMTTAMYTLVNNVLLKPLPFPNSEELVVLSTYNAKTGAEDKGFSDKGFRALSDTPGPINDLAFWAFEQAVIPRGEMQIPYTMEVTSGNYLQTYGVKPTLGRWYDENDINKDAIVISYELWKTEFNLREDVLSLPITLDGKQHKIVGVMPESFGGSVFANTNLWKPIDRMGRPVNIMGRLPNNVTIEQAITRSQAWQTIFDQMSNNSESLWKLRYTSILDSKVASSRPSLYLLLVAVLAVFLIAVLNVVNLSFAQFSNRIKELAVRVSVGATRARLMRQLLVENLLLCVIGGAFGLLIAAWALEWIQAFMGNRLPRASEIAMDFSTVIAVIVLISVSALATALIPAFTIANPSKLIGAVKQAGNKATADSESQRVRRFLVGGEVCVAVVLLVCAGLLLRSYATLAEQETGFNSERVVTGHVWLSDGFKPRPTQAAFWLRLKQELEAAPGISKVAASSTMPMSRTGIDYTLPYSYPGAAAVPAGEEPTASIRSITPDYFDVLQIPILEGREFDQRDTSTSPKVVIINQHLAEAIWPGENAVGNKISLPAWIGGDEQGYHQVVGVVGNVKHRNLKSENVSEFFLPVTQHSYPGMSYVVKTNKELDEKTADELKNVMLQRSVAVEPSAPFILLHTLSSLTIDTILNERLLLTILLVFACLAILLASIGVYGISDFMVTQRTNEIGIRMAIGAKPKTIRTWVLKDTARPVVIGAILGIVFAFVAARYLSSVLYGVQAWDPITFVTIPLILLLVGLVATWVPVRKATRIHPQKALQYE